MVAYFHGGGWVLGGHDSDDPFCRDLCARTGAVVVSVDYRLAPEHRVSRGRRGRACGLALDREQPR
jgi:acetyl esterase/lipase